MNKNFKKQYRVGVLLVSIAAISWSTAGLFVRLIPVDAWTMLFWRGVFGGIFITCFTMFLQRGDAIRGIRSMGWSGIQILLFSTLSMVALIPAFKMTTVANVVIIAATIPIVTAGFAWLLLREPVSSKTVFSGVLVIAGVAIMVGDSAAGGVHWGEILAIVSTCISAVTLILIRRYYWTPLLPITCLSCFLGAVLVIPLASPLSVDLPNLAYLALFGFVQIVLGLALFNVGTSLIPASQTGLIVATQTPMAPLWVWVAFSEVPTPNAFVGGCLVMIAVVGHLALTNFDVPIRLRHQRH